MTVAVWIVGVLHGPVSDFLNAKLQTRRPSFHFFCFYAFAFFGLPWFKKLFWVKLKIYYCKTAAEIGPLFNDQNFLENKYSGRKNRLRALSECDWQPGLLLTNSLFAGLEWVSKGCSKCYSDYFRWKRTASNESSCSSRAKNNPCSVSCSGSSRGKELI